MPRMSQPRMPLTTRMLPSSSSVSLIRPPNSPRRIAPMTVVSIDHLVAGAGELRGKVFDGVELATTTGRENALQQ